MSFRYTAFLSYSSKDGVLVKRIHRALETYPIPRSLVGKPGRDGPIPKNLFPIFRDRDELPLASDLGATLHDALNASRCLVVVCSPNSAKSLWVNEEIRYFKMIGREDRIFALIVNGVPNASDSTEEKIRALECFPPALRYRLAPDGSATGPRTEPIGGDIRKEGDGERAALLKTVAGLLGVGYNDLAQRELKRRRWNQALLAGLVLLLITMGLFIADYYRTKVNNYGDMIEFFSAPSGYGPLTQDEIDHRPFHYEVESSRYEVRVVRRLNSEGQLVDVLKDFDSAVREIHYREDGQVSEIEMINQKGLPILKEEFGELQDLKQTESYVSAFQDQPFSLSMKGDRKVNLRRTVITAKRDTYNAMGQLIREEYLDNYRNPVSDNTGVFGLENHYDASGHIVDKINLDADGNPVENHFGVSLYHYDRDAHENVIATEFFNKAHAKVLCRDDYYKEVKAYDNYGREIQVDYLDTREKPIICKLGYARVTNKFNDHGNLVETAFFDADGQPMLGLDGYARVVFNCDEKGRHIEESYFGVDGKPTLASEHVSIVEFKYDSRDNIVGESYFGKNGKPILNRAGIAGFVHQFDENGKLVKISFLGIDGQPVLSNFGIASLEQKFNAKGNIIERDYLGLKGEPVLNKEGYAKLTSKYDLRGNPISKRYIGLDGAPVLSNEGFASQTDQYDEQGDRIQVNYFGVDNQPILTTFGYATECNKFDARGNLTEQSYLGTDGKLIDVNGVARLEYTVDKGGKITKTVRYNAAGQVVP